MEPVNKIDWKLVFIAVAVAALICWLFIFGGKEKALQVTNNITGGNANGNSNEQSNPQTQSTAQTQSNTQSQFSGWTWPIGKGTGSKAHPSDGVKKVQRIANYYKKEDIDVDGIWGDHTETAVHQLRDTVRRHKSSYVLGDAYQFGSIIPNDTEIRLDAATLNKMISFYNEDIQNHTNANII